MWCIQPRPYGLRLVEEFMENLQGTLHQFERRLAGLCRRIPMDGFVIQLQSFGESSLVNGESCLTT